LIEFESGSISYFFNPGNNRSKESSDPNRLFESVAYGLAGIGCAFIDGLKLGFFFLSVFII
jgi:hypothetical protein